MLDGSEGLGRVGRDRTDRCVTGGVIVGKVMVDISNELLRELLCLPDDVSVLGAVLPERPDCVRLVLEGDGFATEPEGASRIVTPVIEVVQAPQTRRFLRWM